MLSPLDKPLFFPPTILRQEFTPEPRRDVETLATFPIFFSIPQEDVFHEPLAGSKYERISLPTAIVPQDQPRINPILSVAQPGFPIKRIPRPTGPLSKPNRGGYSLRQTLDWDIKTYRKVQVSAH